MAFEQNPVLQNLAYGTQMPINIPQVGIRSLQKPQGFFEKLGNFFTGQGPQQYTSSPYGQNQQQAFNQLLQMGMQNQQNPYAGFEPIQQQIMSQFYNQIVPGIASRFTGLTGGALSSPSLIQQLGSGGRGLAESLAAHKAQFGQQQQQLGLRQAQLGLTPQYETAYTGRQPGFLENLLQLAPQVVQAYGAYNNPLALLGAR
jgi:hypothetical protein